MYDVNTPVLHVAPLQPPCPQEPISGGRRQARGYHKNIPAWGRVLLGRVLSEYVAFRSPFGAEIYRPPPWDGFPKGYSSTVEEGW